MVHVHLHHTVFSSIPVIKENNIHKNVANMLSLGEIEPIFFFSQSLLIKFTLGDPHSLEDEVMTLATTTHNTLSFEEAVLLKEDGTALLDTLITKQLGYTTTTTKVISKANKVPPIVARIRGIFLC